MAALPAVQLKDFVVTERLGSGSYGDVYKARRKSGARDVVAVKCVLKSKLSKAETDNLISEISLLKQLKHEHVVEMLDFCWDANYIYIIMEYCGGGDLSRFIKSRKSLPEDVCKRFLQQLAAALRFLRAKNIAHLDLKPSNILLTSLSHRPILRLADFGFAQYLKSDQQKTSIRGSPLYMAPEMVLKHLYDAKVDLWSVGVILFECLFGRAPYKSASVEELLQKVKDAKPIVIPDSAAVSEQCRDLLTKLLQRDPAKRISFEDFFEHPFLDLEHMPSDEALAKALSLVEEAVRKDQAGQLAEALALYKAALEYFIPIVQWEKSATKKEALRKRTNEYIQRAESIKAQLFPERSVSRLQERSSVESSLLDELMKLSAVTPKMLTGLEIAKAAELYELEGQYPTALDKYHAALGMLLPLLNSEPSSRRKTMLHAEVTRWLNKAECIKEVISIQEKVLAQDGGQNDVGASSDKCVVQ